jgi:hypothetical protein
MLQDDWQENMDMILGGGGKFPAAIYLAHTLICF